MDEAWTWVRNGCRIVDAEHRKVVEVCVSYCDDAELNRRGRLIAAAPELLKALDEARRTLCDIAEGREWGAIEEVIQSSDAALSKALSKALSQEEGK